jgi:hypothetical protein
MHECFDIFSQNKKCTNQNLGTQRSTIYFVVISFAFKGVFPLS